MSEELYKLHRPRKLEQILGQESAVAILQSKMASNKIPHYLLLSGPSGCGKTTIGRILKRFLKCGNHDFQEINCADFKGIDTVRDIRRTCNLSPIDGPCKIFFIDEAHKLTNDAQNAFLKLLEDTPKHVYFILATTDPQKLVKTMMTRATEIKLGLLSAAALMQEVNRVAALEKIKLTEEVIEQIVEAAEGSARKALVLLDQIASVEGEEEQLKALSVSVLNKDQSIELARALFGSASWNEVAKLLKELKDEPESIRYLVLGYARSVLLSGGKQSERAFKIISVFEKNFYDGKAASLAAACYYVVVK